jgi:hypothetical protein
MNKIQDTNTSHLQLILFKKQLIVHETEKNTAQHFIRNQIVLIIVVVILNIQNIDFFIFPLRTLVWHIVLYGRLAVIVKEDHSLGVLANRVLREIFGPKGNDVP